MDNVVGQAASPEMPRGRRAAWIAAGAVAAVLLVGGGAYWAMERKEGVVRPAAEGEVAERFPREFLIEPGAYIEESFSVNHDGGVSQSAVAYVSGRSLRDNIEAFRAILLRGGWQIAHDADPNAPRTFFYAEKDGQAFSAAFDASEEEAVKVTAAHMTAQ